MDATAVVSTALTIDLNNFIKGALINAIPLPGHYGTPRVWKTGSLRISAASRRCGLTGAGIKSLVGRPIPPITALAIRWSK